MSTNESRLHGLDAVRGLALLLGVVLHASMSFLPGPQVWFVADAARSTTLSVAFFVIHLMRMTVFFLIAGFFGRMMLHRLGARGFLADRLKRIAVPLLVGWPVVSVAFLVVLYAASDKTKEPAPLPALSAESFPLTHLWFLYVLLIVYAAMLVVRGAILLADRKARLRDVLDRVMRGLFIVGPVATVVLAVPITLALYQHPYWAPWFGIPTPDMTLYPNRAALVTYGLAFALGWIAQRLSGVLLPRWERQWHWHLTIAIVATIACLRMVGVDPLLMPIPQGTRKLNHFANAIGQTGNGCVSVVLQIKQLNSVFNFFPCGDF